ncbi:hypothetical protein EBU94_00385 [bacterium]|jgi:hypothetical protein|nr:hypothetical protein [bacterium]
MPFYFPNTQETKPVIKDNAGNEYFDFLQKDILIQRQDSVPPIIDYYVVTDNSQMRIDLISKDMYGYDSDYVERILKFNGISNPLSIDSGDILVIYDPYALTNVLRSTSNAQSLADEVRKQYITPEKKSKVDPTLQAFDKRNKESKKVESTNLPPNYADFGDTEVEVRGGKIYLGPNVSKSKNETDSALSKSEFIARLVKNGKKTR